jgi:hypothetical protein
MPVGSVPIYTKTEEWVSYLHLEYERIDKDMFGIAVRSLYWQVYGYTQRSVAGCLVMVDRTR